MEYDVEIPEQVVSTNFTTIVGGDSTAETLDAMSHVGAYVMCSLSIMGALSIMMSYYCFRDLRKPARELLVYLSIADLATAVTYIVSLSQCTDIVTAENYPWNLTQALMGIYFPVAAFLWTDCIAFYLWGATYKRPFVQHTRPLMRAFHAFAWGIPLVCIFTLTVAALQDWRAVKVATDMTGGWCWVDGIAWQLLGGKVVEILSYLILPVLNCRTYMKLRMVHNLHAQHGTFIAAGPAIRGRVQMVDEARHVQMRRRLLLIPVVFILLRIWGTIRAFLVFFCPECRNGSVMPWLHFLQAICDPAQGFANGTIFVLLSTPVRSRIRDSICRAFGAKNIRSGYKARLISSTEGGTITTVGRCVRGGYSFSEYPTSTMKPGSMSEF